MEINKNYPLPKPRISFKEKILQMKVGDSFDTDLVKRPYVSNLGHVHDMKFTTRTISPGVIRVWRTA